MWKFYLYIMVMWVGGLPLLAAPDLTVMRDRDQTIAGNKTFSGALVATNTVSLKGYVVDSFAASLLAATNSADVRSKVGLGGAALLNVGTTGGTVAAGNDSRLVNAVQQLGTATVSSLSIGTSTVSPLISEVTGGSGQRLVLNNKAYSINSNDPATQLQFISTNSTSNMLFVMSKAGVHTSYFGESGTNFVIGTEGSGTVSFKTGMDYLSANVLGSGTERFYISSMGASVVGDFVLTTAGNAVKFASGASISSGAGSPEGAVSAPVGSLYLRSDGGAGTTLYVKQSGSGNTGWVGK